MALAKQHPAPPDAKRPLKEAEAIVTAWAVAKELRRFIQEESVEREAANNTARDPAPSFHPG